MKMAELTNGYDAGFDKETEYREHTQNRLSGILPDVSYFVGHTPMVRFNRLPQACGLKCEVVGKCELFNPGGSHKDRIAVRMIEEAEEAGVLKPNSVIIEPSSGNTGIAMSLLSAVKGYKCIIVMPEKMSTEKMDTMRVLGAEIVRAPNVPIDNPEHSYNLAAKIRKETTGGVTLDQYENHGNPQVHYDDTAEEILEQCGNRLDMIVLGAGTGGMISGIGRKIKQRLPNCLVIGVDPEGSALAKPNDGKEGQFWEVEGIGHDYRPGVLDLSVVDKWYKVEDDESFQMARRIISEEGILSGGSCGSAVLGAIKAAKDFGLADKADKRIVVVLPDSIRNYMTKFLSDQWMLERDFLPTDEQANNYSWWKKPISALRNANKRPPIITTDTNLRQAIALMKAQGHNFAVSVDEDGTLKAVLTMQSLLEKIVSMELEQSAPAGNYAIKKFKKLPPESTLGKLACVLSGHPFVIVIHKDSQQKEKPIGVITQQDLTNYLFEKEFQLPSAD